MAGLILGLGLAAGLDLLRGKPLFAPKPRGAVEPVFADETPLAPEVPILGYVPAIDAGAPASLDAARYMARFPADAFSHAVRAIAGRLAADGPGRVLVLAPLTAGAGGSALARCLAAALGAAGKRVLLIDADGTGRTLSRALGAANRVGLAEVLAGAAPVAAAVVPQPAFAFLPAGTGSLDPASGAAARRLRTLLAEARPRFDLILVDGAARDRPGAPGLPLGAADGHLLVATTADMLEDRFVPLVDAITAEPHFAGLILNRTVPPHDSADLAMAS